jgi:sugar/nucleoside kinase (ribokinase family)
LQIARSANVPVILDAGGTGTPIPQELLKCVTVLSANELEVARLTGMPINTWEQVIKAAAKIQLMVWFFSCQQFLSVSVLEELHLWHAIIPFCSANIS